MFNPTVGKLVFIFLGFGIVWILIKTIQNNLLTKIRDNDSRYKAKKFSELIGYFLTMVLITAVFGGKLGGLTVALGVSGAGIAFTLQEVIVSFAGWLANIFGGFYKSGDRIQPGGIKGEVIYIGVLRTTLMDTGQWVDGDLYNGRIVHIANSFVFKEPVYNYSSDFPFLWDEIKIPVRNRSDFDKAENIFLDAIVSLTSRAAEKMNGSYSWINTNLKMLNPIPL